MFDLSKEEVVKRRQVYLDEEKKYGKKPPSSLKTKPPPAKKMVTFTSPLPVPKSVLAMYRKMLTQSSKDCPCFYRSDHREAF